LLSDESYPLELTQKAMEMDFCVVFCGFGDAIVRDCGSDSRCGSTHDTHVKRVSQRSPESRGFPLGTLVPATGNVDRVGWDKVRHES
jgi:hypothetical protein